MTIAIVSTKIRIPPLPQSMVTRGHLAAKLEAGARGKVVLVSAPAGAGKTSLLAEWAHGRGKDHPVAWVHLDEGDNEPARFLGYLIAALQAHQIDLGEAALSGLQATPPAAIEAVLTSLVNDIDALGRELIVILDDYQVIETPAVHRAVGSLIEHSPANTCLVLATRSDPPLPVHVWRARGQVTEIRAGDLRFSLEETRRFLEANLKQAPSAEEIAALDSRIEGWAAGLQMAALSLQGRTDAGEFIQSFSGSHRYIMDYLMEEIFTRQPENVRSFLVQTSLLERMSGPLCEAVLGKGFFEQAEGGPANSGQEMLEHLERANLFLLPLDEERQWYRYHRLFAGLLRQRLRQTRASEMPELLKRASAWCAANGEIEAALQYALAADDVQAAATLVEEHGMALLKRGAVPTLRSWLERLPEAVVAGRPWLSVFCSWTLLLTGSLENIEGYLGAAETGSINPKERDDVHGHIAAIRAYALAIRGKGEEALAQAREALARLPENNLTVRSVVAFVMGGIHYMRKDTAAALAAMNEASRSGEKAGNLHLAVAALNAVGGIQRSQGKLAEAEKTYARALTISTGRSGRPLPMAAGAYVGLAEVHATRRDLKKAREFARTGVELAGQWGNVDSQASSYLALAHVAHLEGNAAGAQLALEEAKSLAASHRLTPGFEERMAAYEAFILGRRKEGGEQGSLIEPLSERELEVLWLMAAGQSNAEIAGELVIALGTVKAHSSSIYRKLAVRSRTEAVIKAGELGLIRSHRQAAKSAK